MERWDVVCLDGVRLDPALLRAAAAALAPGGRLIVVADNRWSPIRLVDRAVGLSVGLPGTRMGHLTQQLSANGLDHLRVFGLLRSSTDSSKALDVRSPIASTAVLLASSADLSRMSLALLGILTHRVRVGWESHVMPGWAVIASAQPETDRPAVVGRIGCEWMAGAGILLGEPPQEFEKRYETPEEADTEAMALSGLVLAGLDIGPRLLSRPSAQSLRMTWRQGSPLNVNSLSPAQRKHWVVAAASVLCRIQDATRRPDGSVLVHGDFWLGNVLVVDGTISTVIDWGSARWGSPTVDADFLVDSLGESCQMRQGALAELRACRDRALSEETA